MADYKQIDRFGRPYSDLTERIAGRTGVETQWGHLIYFHSIPLNKSVSFKAFITDFKDKFDSSWNDEETFGRMDPISTFKNTKRTISLSWTVPAASVEEAKFNLEQAEELISMLYPVYEEFSVSARESLSQGQVDLINATEQELLDSDLPEDLVREYSATMAQRLLESEPTKKERRVGVMVAAPLFKLKFANFAISNGEVSISGNSADSGLVGKLSGLTFDPDMDMGFFGSAKDFVPAGGLVPKVLRFSCEFTVLHTDSLGWDSKSGKKRSKNFPYHSSKIR